MPLDVLSVFSTGDSSFEAVFTRYCQTLLGVSIFPYELPQKVALPAGTYSLIGFTPVNNLDGGSGVNEIRIQFDFYSEDYGDCVALSESIRPALNGFQGNIENVKIHSCWFENDFGGYDPNIDGSDRGSYHRSIDFTVIAED